MNIPFGSSKSRNLTAVGSDVGAEIGANVIVPSDAIPVCEDMPRKIFRGVDAYVAVRVAQSLERER